MDYSDLVGTAEAADILGFEKSRVGRYARSGKMPKPVAELHATKVWRARDVENLRDAIAEHGERGTQPPTHSRPLALVGTREAAELLGVERTRIGRWRKSGYMPEPLVELHATPVWHRRDIVALRDRRERDVRDREAVRAAREAAVA